MFCSNPRLTLVNELQVDATGSVSTEGKLSLDSEQGSHVPIAGGGRWGSGAADGSLTSGMAEQADMSKVGDVGGLHSNGSHHHGSGGSRSVLRNPVRGAQPQESVI